MAAGKVAGSLTSVSPMSKNRLLLVAVLAVLVALLARKVKDV